MIRHPCVVENYNQSVNLRNLEGKRIALVLTDERNESVAFTGLVHWDGDLLLSIRKDPDAPFHIRQEWQHRIRVTPDESKHALLGAEFFLRLSVGDQPVEADQPEFQKTGLQWPKD